MSNGDQINLILFHASAHKDPSRDSILGVGRRLQEDMIWLHEYCSDVVENASHGYRGSAHYSRAMRLLHCSSEDAESIWFWQCLETPPLRWHNVPSKPLIKDMLHRYVPADHGGRTPLQLVAVFLACTLALQHLSDVQHIEEITALTIATGAELHGGDHHHTPLLLFLSVLSGYRYLGDLVAATPRERQRGLVAWLRILQKAGVDLVAYGAEENRQFLMYRSLKNPEPPLHYWHNIQPLNFTDEVLHFNISYGPTPEDWTAKQDHMFDQYVGDFWRMPGLLDEAEVRPIPGAWIEQP